MKPIVIIAIVFVLLFIPINSNAYGSYHHLPLPEYYLEVKESSTGKTKVWQIFKHNPSTGLEFVPRTWEVPPWVMNIEIWQKQGYISNVEKFNALEWFVTNIPQ